MGRSRTMNNRNKKKPNFIYKIQYLVSCIQDAVPMVSCVQYLVFNICIQYPVVESIILVIKSSSNLQIFYLQYILYNAVQICNNVHWQYYYSYVVVSCTGVFSKDLRYPLKRCLPCVYSTINLLLCFYLDQIKTTQRFLLDTCFRTVKCLKNANISCLLVRQIDTSQSINTSCLT